MEREIQLRIDPLK